MKHTILMTSLLLTLSTSVLASDHWANCSDSFGSTTLEYGELTRDGKIMENVEIKVLNKKVIKEDLNHCILKGTNHKVISYYNETSVKEIAIKHDEEFTEKVMMICDEGGSGIPAAASCEE